MAGTLQLRAEDEEDLAVISSCLQDALVPLSDMQYDRAARRFVLAVNRFRWEGGTPSPPGAQSSGRRIRAHHLRRHLRGRQQGEPHGNRPGQARPSARAPRHRHRRSRRGAGRYWRGRDGHPSRLRGRRHHPPRCGCHPLPARGFRGSLADPMAAPAPAQALRGRRQPRLLTWGGDICMEWLRNRGSAMGRAGL